MRQQPAQAAASPPLPLEEGRGEGRFQDEQHSSDLPQNLLHRAERLLLAIRVTLAMLALGLLGVALLWRLAFPDQAATAELVAGIAAALVAVPVLAAAWRSLRHPSLHGVTDRLIALALVAAWASGDLMTAAILPIVMIVGHVLEERSLLGSREAIGALGRLTETTARRVRDGVTGSVPVADLRIGDVIELRAGDRLPIDGVVLRGRASLDTASLTGESVPVDVASGDTVLAGSIDTDGQLLVTVSRIGAGTTLGRIVALMRDAEHAKPPLARLLERHAGQYMALVLMVAAATWFASGDIAATLAVLVAACPCALVLAAPATAIAAIAAAARHGILIKGAGFLENLAGVSSVVFDKTGTLTTGELSVCAGDAHALRVAGSLGAASTHPVSRAAARAVPVDQRLDLAGVRESGGLGLTAQHEGQTLAFGRAELFESLGIATPSPPAHDGPVAGVARGGTFLGWLCFADQLRPEAGAAVQDLRRLGLTRQTLLSGDRAAVAARIGATLGIDEIVAEALPEAKLHHILAQTRAGWRPLVVGDGINDSLALKAGAIGVAMGAHGTDVARAASDIVLMTSDLRRLGTALRLSRRCRRTIHANVALGLVWTAALVALAASGLLGREGAVLAALLHNVSTFAGLANAGRLLRFDEPLGPA